MAVLFDSVPFLARDQNRNAIDVKFITIVLLHYYPAAKLQWNDPTI